MITINGQLACDPGESPCDTCKQPVNKDTWGQTGGDGFNGRCCGIMDHPTISDCEFCGAEYMEGEQI